MRGACRDGAQGRGARRRRCSSPTVSWQPITVPIEYVLLLVRRSPGWAIVRDHGRFSGRFCTCCYAPSQHVPNAIWRLRAMRKLGMYADLLPHLAAAQV